MKCWKPVIRRCSVLRWYNNQFPHSRPSARCTRSRSAALPNTVGGWRGNWGRISSSWIGNETAITALVNLKTLLLPTSLTMRASMICPHWVYCLLVPPCIRSRQWHEKTSNSTYNQLIIFHDLPPLSACTLFVRVVLFFWNSGVLPKSLFHESMSRDICPPHNGTSTGPCSNCSYTLVHYYRQLLLTKWSLLSDVFFYIGSSSYVVLSPFSRIQLTSYSGSGIVHFSLKLALFSCNFDKEHSGISE